MIYARMPRLTRFKLFGLGQGLGSSGGNLPSNKVAPVVSGTTTTGSTLTCTTGTWTNSPTSYKYQWVSAGVVQTFVGTNQNTYVPQSTDIGNNIYCLVSATNGYGTGGPVQSNSVGPITKGIIAVRGTPTQGNLLAATAVTLPAFQVGDLLAVVIYATTAAPPGTPTGWTPITPITGTSQGLYAYFKFATGGDTFVSTLSITQGVYNAYAIENANTGLDTMSGAVGTSTSPINSGSITTSLHPDLLICAFASLGTNPVIGTPSGSLTATSQQTAAGVAGLVTGYKTLSTAGSNLPLTASVSGNTEWEGGSLAFN